MKKNVKSLTILKGEGANCHVLVGEEIVYDEKKGETSLSELHVGKNGSLTHVDPAGHPAEHHAIPVEEGTWLVGRQVEYNPFTQSISGVFD